MDIKLSSKIKPLIANLLRLGIGKYLKTSEFDHIVLENDYDDLWSSALRKVNAYSSVIFVGFEFTGEYEDALKLILEESYQNNKEGFFRFLKIVLGGFIKWDKGKNDYAPVIMNLSELGMSEESLESIRGLISGGVELINVLSPTHSPEFSQAEIEVDENLCFVIMPFSDKLNPVYTNVIKPVIEGLNFTCKRADEIFESKPIIDDIWLNIKKARFLIADLTDKNPNVFYELGLAHAQKKDVILISQDLEDIPFDLRHYRIIIYKDSLSESEELKKKITNFVRFTLGE